MSKRPADTIVDGTDGIDSPVKRQKTSDDEKSPHAGQTLVFFDLGNRKGTHFPPKIFYQMPTRTYEILLHALDVNLDEEDVYILGEYNLKCPIERDDIKFAASFDVDPDAYLQAHKYFTEVLQQNLKTYGLHITIC